MVYTSRRFQPYAESFSDHYAFVGPSVFSKVVPNKEKARPLVYISMGTVINDRPDFYGKCFEALKDLDVDVLISCGNAVDREKLGTPPENFKLQAYVNQLDVLSRADVFITHCGMNSVSESLYMAAPMVGAVSGVILSQRTALPMENGTSASLFCRSQPFLVSVTIIWRASLSPRRRVSMPSFSMRCSSGVTVLVSR